MKILLVLCLVLPVCFAVLFHSGNHLVFGWVTDLGIEARLITVCADLKRQGTVVEDCKEY